MMIKCQTVLLTASVTAAAHRALLRLDMWHSFRLYDAKSNKRNCIFYRNVLGVIKAKRN